MGRLLLSIGMAVALACAWAGGAFAQARSSDFSDWAVVVIAGDWRSHAGGETEAFDNTRRDVSAALVRAGFRADNMVQFSLRPPRPGDDPAIVTDPQHVLDGFERVANKAPSGCLFYISSHGSPEGAVFGPTAVLRPMALGKILDALCPGKPTVAVISACYSGVFVDPLAAPNRLIMTAARPDRSSFGCSDKDRYPYFDACILQSFPQSTDFVVLSRRAKACVDKRETDEHLQPASEPQTYIGSQAKVWAPFMRFASH